MRVTSLNDGVLGDHPVGTRRRDRTRLGGSQGRRRGRVRTGVTQGAVRLGMARTVDLTNWTNIPLTVDADVSKMMTFETSLTVVRVVMREGGINGYAMNGHSGINFMMEFGTLEG